MTAPIPTPVLHGETTPLACGRLRIREADVEFGVHRWTQVLISDNNGHPGAIAVATRPDGAVLFIRTWRQATGTLAWELPRGGGTVADPVQTATRELAEETGYTPTGPGRFLGWSDRDSAFLTDKVGFVAFDIAADAVPTSTDQEALDVAWFTRRQINQMIADGHLTCGMTLTGLALLDAHTALDADARAAAGFRHALDVEAGQVPTGSQAAPAASPEPHGEDRVAAELRHAMDVAA